MHWIQILCVCFLFSSKYSQVAAISINSTNSNIFNVFITRRPNDNNGTQKWKRKKWVATHIERSLRISILISYVLISRLNYHTTTTTIIWKNRTAFLHMINTSANIALRINKAFSPPIPAAKLNYAKWDTQTEGERRATCNTEWKTDEEKNVNRNIPNISHFYCWIRSTKSDIYGICGDKLNQLTDCSN